MFLTISLGEKSLPKGGGNMVSLNITYEQIDLLLKLSSLILGILSYKCVLAQNETRNSRKRRKK